jgi:hypothetical protein
MFSEQDGKDEPEKEDRKISSFSKTIIYSFSVGKEFRMSSH